MWIKGYVDSAMRFFAGLPHVTGKWARKGEKFEPEPWQLFFFAELLGWREGEDKAVRRYREAVLEIAKKNGKTFMLSALGLYMMEHDDMGAEIYSVATKRAQAKLVWSPAKKMVINGGLDMMINSEQIYTDNAFFEPLGRGDKTHDGFSPSCVIVDEAAAILIPNVIQVLTNAMGARESPLTVYITTAQADKTTLYYDKRTYLDNVLAGRIQDEQFFGLLYHLEKEDDYRDEATWIKANPNLDVSCSRAFLRSQVKQAGVIAQEVNDVKTKHFNLWVGVAVAWLEDTHWIDLSIDILRRSGPCFLGVDLSQSKALTAVAAIWAAGGALQADVQHWMPEVAYKNIHESHAAIYAGAVKSGSIRICSGHVVDYDAVEKHIRGLCEDHEVMRIAFDPYNATSMVNRLETDGLPVLTVSQRMSRLSSPTKDLERMIYERRIQHLPDKFMDWQLTGCVVYTDEGKNIKVKMGTDKHHHIDGWIALINAIAAWDHGDDVIDDRSFHYEAFEG